MKYIDPDGESATSTVVGWIGTDIATPEPTDAVLWKWVGYGVVIAGAVVIDYFVAKTVSKASAKAKEQAKAVAISEKGNPSFFIVADGTKIFFKIRDIHICKNRITSYNN